jgi:acetyl-CoA C-acetyltransferase
MAMNKTMRPAFIIGGRRIPFVKSMTKYMGVSTQELMVESLKALIGAYGLNGQQVGDVALGAVMNSASNWNLARECVLSSGLHPFTPGYNVQRACGTGLEAAWHMALKIGAGQIETGIAGGVDTNSDLPIEISLSLRDKLLALNSARTTMDRLKIFATMGLRDLKPRMPAVVEPRTKDSMGQHT